MPIQGITLPLLLVAIWLPNAVFAGQKPVMAAPLAFAGGRDIARGDQSNIDERREVVVRSQKEWTALWRQHDFEREAPRVDFTKEMVVAVFLGSQTTAGHAVRIVGSASDASGFVIRYQVDRPAAGGVAAQVLTFPFHIVAMPIRAGAARFQQVE